MLLTKLSDLLLRDDGQDLIEYGLLAALIAVIAVAGIATLGDTIFTVFWRDIAQAV